MQPMADVVIRRARRDDAAFLAWVMLTASRSHVEQGMGEYITGNSFEELLPIYSGASVSNEIHMGHSSLFLVAELDGQPAAALCGYDPNRHRREPWLAAMDAIRGELGQPISDPAGLPGRFEVVGSATLDELPGAWVVEWVATVPEYRRRGLVDLLLEEILARGRADGFTRAQIGVAIGNDPARNAYVKHGFTFEAERRSEQVEAALGYPGQQRLTRHL
jgi:ribosomal protein S18 acetylase RimI-like enzyme